MTERDLERFMEKVLKTSTVNGCWLWQAAVNDQGYGTFQIDGKRVGAHVAAYEHFKEKPIEKMCCHTCDNKSCVNPDHLYDADQLENMRDHAEKYGTWCSKLKREEVVVIKKRLANGERPFEIAKDYPNLTRQAINGIRTGKSYAWVTI